MHTRFFRWLTVVVCASVVLLQAAVSSGALRHCRCGRAGQNCCQAKPAPAPSACCCALAAEKAAGCCCTQGAGFVRCECSKQSQPTQTAERPRMHEAEVDLAVLAWVAPPVVPAVDVSPAIATPPALWPPGVRLQSLLCVWLI
jgi:hypothetical protein